MAQLTPLEQGLADVEFQADLSRSPSHDAVARLGMEHGRAKIQLRPFPSSAFMVKDERTASFLNNNLPGAATDDIRANDILVETGRATPAIWNHEFRHVGAARLRQGVVDGSITFNDYKERFGDDAVTAFRWLSGFEGSEEAMVEAFDNPDEDAGAFGRMGNTIQFSHELSNEDAPRVRRVLTQMALDVLEEEGVPTASEKRQARSFLEEVTNE